jgi:hypothetical protein|uniref:Glycosyltransferase 2-like domain-containing protein n=1 Tax=viral metagenome TaxID=1070528 RepID=A0A6C0JGG4_9ZZZZ
MKIAFVFIVKDGEKYLEKNLNTIKKYNQDIYAVENNSVDNTKIILRDSGIKNVITLDLDKKHSTELCTKEVNCSERVRRLAYIRQKGVDAVINSGVTYDYVCMLDMDFLDYDEKGLIDMFQYMETHKDVDGIFGMSIDRNNIPYDTHVVTPTHKLVPIITKLNRYVCVDSAFSGFGIYRYSSMWDTGAKYDYKNINEIEHIHFNKNFNKLIVDTQFNPRYISLAEDKMRFRIMIVILMLILFYLIKNNIRK